MLRNLLVTFGLVALVAGPAAAEDRVLEDVVAFTVSVLSLGHQAPGLVIGAVRNGETAVAGFGETRADGGEPGGDTLLRIGSITKVFTALTLAHLAADRKVRLTDPVEKRLDWSIDVPTKDGKQIRLIDLATHASGLPREIDVPQGPPEDSYAFHTKESFISNFEDDPLMFAPGTGVFYPTLPSTSCRRPSRVRPADLTKSCLRSAFSARSV